MYLRYSISGAQQKYNYIKYLVVHLNRLARQETHPVTYTENANYHRVSMSAPYFLSQ
jgi:hypothetical protein